MSILKRSLSRARFRIISTAEPLFIFSDDAPYRHPLSLYRTIIREEPGVPNVSQIVYANRDIKATALAMVERDGIGPFFLAEFPLYDLSYQGEPAFYDHIKVAFAYHGQQQIELLQVPEDVHSIYTEGLEDRREIFHHVYTKSNEDFDAIVARYEQAGEMATYTGVSIAGEDRIRFCYIDARQRLGHFVEILETNKMIGPAAKIFEIYAKMGETARNWDGSRPLREIANMF